MLNVIASTVFATCFIILLFYCLGVLIVEYKDERWWNKYYDSDVEIDCHGKTIPYKKTISFSSCIFCKNKNGEWCVLGFQTKENNYKWSCLNAKLRFHESPLEVITSFCKEKLNFEPKISDIRLTSTSSKLENGSLTFDITSHVICEGTTVDYPTKDVNILNAKWIHLSNLDNFLWVDGQYDLITKRHF